MNVIRRINGIALSVAVIPVLGYLVARPHLITVYVEDISTKAGALESWDPWTEFSSSSACAQAALTDNDAATKTFVKAAAGCAAGIPEIRYRCRPEVRFVWGW